MQTFQGSEHASESAKLACADVLFSLLAMPLT